MNSKIFHFSLKLYFGLNHKYLNICSLFRIYKNILLICIIYKYLKWKEFGFYILKCLIVCMAAMSPFENFYLNKEIFFQYPEIFGRFFFSLAWQSCNHDITSYSKANCLSPVYKKLCWIKGGAIYLRCINSMTFKWYNYNGGWLDIWKLCLFMESSYHT